MKKLSVVLCAMVLVFGFMGAKVGAVEYSVIDLGYDSSGGHTGNIGLNSYGQVVGDFGGSGCRLWENGAITELGTLGGQHSSATDINKFGQIVGDSSTNTGSSQAFSWKNGVMTDLGVLFAGGNSFAYGINESGSIVGRSDNVTGGGTSAFLWQNGVMSPLGVNGVLGDALAINNPGQIVGYYYQVDGGHYYQTACIWENGVVADLGSGQAYGINDMGQVIGHSGWQASLWKNGSQKNLGLLGGSQSMAFAINNHGQAVGWSDIAEDEEHAFFWEDGVITDLNDLIDPSSGWELLVGNDINDNGQIVGLGILNGEHRAFLASPVPIPSAILLLGTGLIGLVGIRRKIGKEGI